MLPSDDCSQERTEKKKKKKDPPKKTILFFQGYTRQRKAKGGQEGYREMQEDHPRGSEAKEKGPKKNKNKKGQTKKLEKNNPFF